jgi:hypothetical protein
MPKTLGKVEAGPRGFPIVRFSDRYGVPCSLQMSSLAEYEKPGTSAVWLGTSDAQPKVMAREAASVGVQTTETTGWVPFPIPESVLLSTRMHLDRKQVAALIHHLQRWLDKDKF